MGDFNVSTPAVRGTEWRPDSVRQYVIDSTGKGLAMRMRPGAITPITMNMFLSKVVGGPGFAVELLSDASALPIGTSGPVFDYQPFVYQSGAGAGGSFTGFTNQAAGAATFAEVSDGANSTYHRNTAAVPAGTPITEYVSMNLVSAGTPNRMAQVTIQSRVQVMTGSAFVRLFLRIGGVNYYGPYQLITAAQGVRDITSSWTYSPATGIPFTPAEYDGFISGATNSIGLEVQGPYASSVAALAFRHYDISMYTYESVENRVYYAYTQALGFPAGSVKWIEKALTLSSGLLAVNANNWYWVHVYPWIIGDGGNSFSIPVLKMSGGVNLATDPASTTAEHRTVAETVIGPGGGVLSFVQTVGEMIPALLETSGPAINSQSQPFADLSAAATIYTGVNNFGVHITTAAATTYAGIALVVGWQDTTKTPDAPLTIELRHGAGAETGGGTLDTSMRINPTDLTAGKLQDFTAKFVSALALLATTQYTVRILSSASNGRGWKVSRMDLKALTAYLGPGVAAADLTGASVNGTTDQTVVAGASDNSTDLAAALVAPPTGPATITTLAVAAT